MAQYNPKTDINSAICEVWNGMFYPFDKLETLETVCHNSELKLLNIAPELKLLNIRSTNDM